MASQGPKNNLNLHHFVNSRLINESRHDVRVYKAQFPNSLDTVAVKTIPLRYYGHGTVQPITLIPPHPNLLAPLVHFYDGSSSSVCFVLPFAAGGSITSVSSMKTPRAMDEKTIAIVLKGVLKAMVHLHGLGIAHRDIKPGNVLISGGVGDFTVQLADHEIGKTFYRRDAGLDDRNDDDVPYWTPPETARCATVYTSKSDMWEFGVTALELFFGGPPVAHRQPASELLLSKFQDRFIGWQGCHEVTPPRPSRLFKDLVEVCLKADPEGRNSAAQLLRHPFFLDAEAGVLEEFMSGIPPVEERPMEVRVALGSGPFNNRRVRGWKLHETSFALTEIF